MSDQILRAQGPRFYNVVEAASADTGHRPIRRTRKDPIYVTTSPVSSAERSLPRTVTPSTTDADTTSTEATDVGSANNSGLNATDHAIAAQSIGMEIAIRDLIRGVGGDETMQILASAHEAFATRVAGIAGIPAGTGDTEFMSDHQSAFTGDAVAAVEAVEFEAADRYAGWMRQVTDGRLIMAFASISVSESRQAAMLAMGSGLDAALDGTSGAGS